LNKACKDKPLPKGQNAGLHVAGFQEWPDGKRRPTLYHVHNGHLHAKATVQHKSETTIFSFGTQSANPAPTPYTFNFPTGQQVSSDMTNFLGLIRQPGVGVTYTYEAEPRTLFEVHQDFPIDSVAPKDNLDRLQNGYLTRNGDYVPYLMIAEAMDSVRLGLNKIPNISVPRDPNEIGARVGFLHMVMETVVRIYKCSNMLQIIGGHVTSLGLRENGNFIGDATSA
jgi:hypothetical protein